MKYSPLQLERYKYVPKLPGMLRNGINEISVKEGKETSSVADQEKIKALFPNTYGKKEIVFEKGNSILNKKSFSDLNKKDNAGFTPLDIAIQDLNYGKIRQLIASRIQECSSVQSTSRV